MINYKEHLRDLLSERHLEIPIEKFEHASTEILDTIVLMLEERDPRFAVEVAGELASVFRRSRSNLVVKISELVTSRGHEKGVNSISFEDALGRVYPNQSIYRIERPFEDRDKSQKLFKNSLLFYRDDSTLIRYLGENTSTELVVTFKLKISK